MKVLYKGNKNKHFKKLIKIAADHKSG